MQLGEDIDGETAGYILGRSVSLLADGETIAIEAPLAGDVFTGQVRVYQIDRKDEKGSSWEPLGQSIYGDNADDYFGWSVDVTPDGNTLAIGSPGNWENND